MHVREGERRKGEGEGGEEWEGQEVGYEGSVGRGRETEEGGGEKERDGSGEEGESRREGGRERMTKSENIR